MNSHPSNPRSFAAVLFALAAFLSPALGITLDEALDAPGSSWQASSFWEAVTSSASRDGSDMAQLSEWASNPNGETLQTTVTGPGVLTLWWRWESLGNDEGAVILKVDGVRFLYRDSVTCPWKQVAVNVPAGSHTIVVAVDAMEGDTVMMVDEAHWSPGARLPAAVALGDADGFWVQEGEWQLAQGESRNGVGDAARIQLPGGRHDFHLIRAVEGPVAVRYWQKIATTTPGHYSDAEGRRFPEAWTQVKTVVPGQPGATGFLRLSARAQLEAAAATVWLDDLELVPLTLAAAVDLPATSPAFSVTAGSNSWSVSGDDSASRGTGSAEVAPGISGGAAEMSAAFNGTGLLTWAYRKWSSLDETLTVSVNGSPLGVFTDDQDSTLGFAHVASHLSGTGTNAVLWRLEWGENGYNPIALDDVLFSPAAGAGLQEAIDLSAGTGLYATAGTPWTIQNTVTHDGSDALELSVVAGAENHSRSALTLPVTGPGILTWWWRSDLPSTAEFRLDRQGRKARSVSGTTGWRQEFLALRTGEEFVRWELLPDGVPAESSHRVWLDEVTFVPQTLAVGDAVDLPGPAWIAAGDVLAATLPFPESSDGTDAVVLTGPHNNRSPAASLEAAFTGPGLVGFRVGTRRGPEYYGHPWVIQLDGEYQPFVRAPDIDGWNDYSLPIPSGTHTIRWQPFASAVMTLDEVSFEIGDGYSRWSRALTAAGQPAEPQDDPDRDGVPNLLEFAFNTLPLDPASADGPFPGKLSNGANAMKFVHDIRQTDLTWEPQVSSDLATWHLAAANLLAIDGFKHTFWVELPPGGGYGRVKVTRGL